MLSDVQSKPSLVQVWTIPVRAFQGEEISTSLSTFPLPEVEESNKVALHSTFLQTRPMKSSYLFLIGHSFQSFYQLGFSLDTFKNFHVLVKLWGPELPTGPKVRLNQCWIQQNNHHFEQLCLMHPRLGFALLATRVPCWACCWPETTDPFLQGLSAATPVPIYTCAWCYSIPGAESIIWISYIWDNWWLPSAPNYFNPILRLLVPQQSHQHISISYHQQA